VTGVTSWPVWATAKIDDLSRTEARNCLVSAQAFWRDFAIAGLTLPEVREVIEERRRKGPGGRIVPPSPPRFISRLAPSLDAPDNSLFDSFPPLDPDDPRWIHA
jgi:hypothetical protein